MKTRIIAAIALSLALANSTRAQSGPGCALSFDGTNDVSVPHSNAFNITSAITIEAWIKATQGNDRYIITKNDDSFYLALGGGGGAVNKLSFFLNGVSAGWLNGTTDLNDNQWHYVAGTYDGASLKVYVDGQSQNSTNRTGSISTGTNPVLIGARPFGSNFVGAMDEIRVWNVARSQTQIQSDMFDHTTTNVAPLVAYWKFDDCSGTNATDATGQGHTGTLVGGPTWIPVQSSVLVYYPFNTNGIPGSGDATFTNNYLKTATIGANLSTFTNYNASAGVLSFPIGTNLSALAGVPSGSAVANNYWVGNTNYFQFTFNATGSQIIIVNYDLARSASGPSTNQFQYSTNAGTAFITFATYFNTQNNNTFMAFTNNLSGVPALTNNPNVVFRIVGTGNPASNETMSVDNFTINAVNTNNSFTITATAGANGSISPNGAVGVNSGANQTFTITPDSCYHIFDVLVDGNSVGTGNSYTFNNVTANHTISASFAINNSLTITATAGANGSIGPNGAVSVNCGTNQAFTITPDSCYHIFDVLVDSVSVGAVSSYTFNNVTANHTISASFASINSFTITATAGAHGSIGPSGAVSVNCSASQAFTITPDNCYHIFDVLVDGNSVGAVSSYTFNNVTANHTISASFAVNTYTINATASTHGSISPSGTVTVNCGADQAFTIIPNAGYQIDAVVVDTVPVGAICSYTFNNVVAGGHTISATFAIHDGTYTPGNLVIYRMGRDANQSPCGDPGCALTSAGTTVWLDEYTPCGQFVYAHMMPTNSIDFGANSPLIGNGTQFGEGMITLSPDGRFILVCGYGAALGQWNTSLLFSDAKDVPRVIGVVGSNGVVDTTTTLVNPNSDRGQIRSAVTDSCIGDNCPSNIWVCIDIAKSGGGGGAIQYATRGASDATKLSGYDTRQLNIFKTAFGEQLFFSSQRRGPIAVLTNANNVTIPTVMNDVSYSTLAGTTISAGPWSFVLFNLRGVDLDTLYVADAGAGVQKFLLSGGSWVPAGFITASGAVGLTGRTRIVGTTTNVDLWMTGGGSALNGGDSLYAVTDPQGYNVVNPTNLIATTLTTMPSGVSGVSLRGIAFAPTGNVVLASSSGMTASSTMSSRGPSVLSGSNSGQLSVGPAIGLSSNGLTGCSLASTRSYSVANFGASNLNWSASCSSNWVSLSPSSGSLTSGGSVTVQASFNSNTASLPTGTNTASITFTNTTSGLGSTTRAVQLILTRQSITPTGPLNITGPLHGPFKPLGLDYLVCNGVTGITVKVSHNNSNTWLNLSSYFGGSASNFFLPGCNCTNISVGVDSFNSSNLPAGDYNDVVTFSNVTAGTLLGTRIVQLTVGGSNSVDNLGTFTNGPLAGQNGWKQYWAHTGTDNLPVVSNQAVYVVARSGPCDGIEPYKNIPVITSGCSYVAMVITVTSAAPVTVSSPSRIWTLWTKQDTGGYPVDSVTARDTGFGGFQLGVRLNGTHSYTFGDDRPYNTPLQVIQRVCASNTISILYVNPTTPTEGGNDQYLVAQDAGVADPGIGSIQFGNCYQQARPSAVQAGVIFYKFGTATTFAEAFQGSLPSLRASFDAGPTNGPAPLNVNFTDTSTGSPTGWAWDFGDINNNTSTAQSPSHTYNAAGTYTVRLIVTDGAGGFSTNTQVNLIHVPTALELWQTIYFGSPSNPNAAPNVDPDGDGMSNTNEFLAGFNPTNSAAYLHVISIAKTGNDINVIYLGANGDSTWSPGISVRTNVLEFTAGTANGSYSNNFASTGQTNILAGGIGLGVVTNMVDTGGATNKPARYYHIRLLVP